MIGSLKVLAIIPARGGSKGVPKKNIKNLNGIPLIRYSIIEAQKSNYIDKIIVSTDSNEISKISIESGVDVIMRPDALSGDKSSSEEAILHVLDSLSSNEGYLPDLVLFIQCTSPLTLVEDIEGLISKLVNSNADSGLSVSKFFHFIWKENEGSLVGINHNETFRPMRQEREEQFLENGALYVFKTKGFLENKYRFFGKIIQYEMPMNRTLEIDEPFDFYLAQSILSMRKRNDLLEALPNKCGLLVMDFDGVFTDNSVYVFEDGREAVKCSRGDGMGLSWLRKFGFPMLVFSTEKNLVVSERCNKLGIEVVQNIDDKLPSLKKLLHERNININDVIYIGNDLNDLDCIIESGCGIAVADAYNEVIKVANIVLNSKGGNGALRELSELLIEKYSLN